MTSRMVSFRFLQAVTNPVTGDHVTVGVLHWDGERLRFACDSSKVAGDRGRSTVARALAAIRSQVDACNPTTPSLLDDVRQVFPVAEGDGSLLRWAEVCRGLTSNSERHFRDLAMAAELAPKCPRTNNGPYSATTRA